MRKSGLHKEIASIFDGVPIPDDGTLSEQADPADEGITAQDAAVNSQPSEPASQSAGPSLAQRLSTDPSDELEAPLPEASAAEPPEAIQIGRPMPMPKSKAMTQSGSQLNLGKQFKKMIYGSNASIDPRQKKAGVLVGILSMVFGVVLFVSLGGVGQTKAVAADATDDSAAVQRKPQKTVEEWTPPAALPENLRDATIPAFKETATVKTSPETTQTTPSQWIVKGIVFSKDKPSAIINNQIISKGETLDGITVVNISKDKVEFESNGKRWTQPVQR